MNGAAEQEEEEDHQRRHPRRLLPSSFSRSNPIEATAVDVIQNVNRVVNSSSGDTVIHELAAGRGCPHGDEAALSAIRNLVASDRQVCLDVANLDGKRPLHVAAQCGKVEVAKLLLELGASVDSLKRADWTPLMMAATKDNLDMIRLLIEMGKADVALRNKDGWTSFHIAAREGHRTVMRYLVDSFGIEIIRTKGNTDRSAIHTMALHGHTELLEYVLNKDSSRVNSQDSCGTTPLMDAARSSNVDTCKVLIKFGADRTLTDEMGRNAMHVAAEAGSFSCIKYFIESLALDVNTADAKSGLTCLHMAAREGNAKVISGLLNEFKADTNLRDHYGRLAKDVATRYKRAECVQLLS